MKTLIGIILLIVAGLAVAGSVALSLPPLAASCGFDPFCAAQQGAQVGIQSAIVAIFAPLLLPAIIMLVALFVLPRFGWKGALLSLLVIGGIILWYLGIPGLLPPFGRVF